MPDFYPPLLNLAVVQFCQTLAPPIARWRYRMDLEVDDRDLETLRGLQNDRYLLLPNHPTFHDWVAIFLLSARLQDSFHYLAAYERFQGSGQRLLQWLGAYSLRRGLGDRASVEQTIRLLMQPGCRLVMFPEGGCSFQNDTVMPFRSGAVQVAMQALNRLVKQGAALPNLYAVPISIKYRYTSNMDRVIHRALIRLERSLHFPLSESEAPEQFYQRLRSIAEQVLVGFERDYGLQGEELAQLSWNQRIATVKDSVLHGCEQRLGITAPAHLPVRERVYKIQYVLESRAEDLAADDFWTYEAIHQALARLLNFDAIYDGYVADAPTAERFSDTIVRIEREVFNIGEPVPKGHRKVILRLGDPVNLKDYFELYRDRKSATIDRLTQALHQQVQMNLDRLDREIL